MSAQNRHQLLCENLEMPKTGHSPEEPPLSKTDKIKVSLGKKIIHFASLDHAYSLRPRKWIINIVYIAIIVGILLYFSLDIKFFNNFRNPNWSKFNAMWYGFFHIDWEYFFGYGGLFDWQHSVIYQVIETFAIAFVGTTIASILSIPFGFLASHKLVGRWAYIAEMILITIRTFPEILFGYIMIKVIGFGSAAGTAVLSIHSVGMIGKMYAEQVDLVDDGPLEALDAVGASFPVKVKLGVVPQIKPNFLSVILYRFDLNIRTASLLGLVGAGGVGYPISIYATNQHWPQLGAVLLGILFLVFAVDAVSTQIRKRLIQGE
jgi:phosphonate transport system permease protein